MIECRRLTKTFGDNRALDAVSCRFPEGVVSALIGPSGAGKTLLLRHILGLTKPDSGEVLVDRRDVQRLPEPELQALRATIGVQFQGPGALFSWLSAYDNVAFQLRNVRNIREPRLREEVLPLLAEVDLEPADAAKLPEQLSTGMRTRVAFARAVAPRPPVLLLDSPEDGLDRGRLNLMRRLIKAHHAAHARTVVLVTHDVTTLLTLAEHVVVLDRGHVVAQGPAAEVRRSRDPRVRALLRDLRSEAVSR